MKSVKSKELECALDKLNEACDILDDLEKYRTIVGRGLGYHILNLMVIRDEVEDVINNS